MGEFLCLRTLSGSDWQEESIGCPQNLHKFKREGTFETDGIMWMYVCIYWTWNRFIIRVQKTLLSWTTIKAENGHHLLTSETETMPDTGTGMTEADLGILANSGTNMFMEAVQMWPFIHYILNSLLVFNTRSSDVCGSFHSEDFWQCGKSFEN